MICCHKIEPKYELPRQYNRVFHMFPSTIYTHFHSVFLSVTLIFWTKIKGSQHLLLGSKSSNLPYFRLFFIIFGFFQAKQRHALDMRRLYARNKSTHAERILIYSHNPSTNIVLLYNFYNSVLILAVSFFYYIFNFDAKIILFI